MKELQNLKVNIRLYRKRTGLSRKELAKKAGLSVYSIVDIELGRVSDVKLTTLLKISKSLNTSIDSLLRRMKS